MCVFVPQRMFQGDIHSSDRVDEGDESAQVHHGQVIHGHGEAAAQTVDESLRAAQPAGGQPIVLVGGDFDDEIAGNARGTGLPSSSMEGQDQVGAGPVFVAELTEVRGALGRQGTVVDSDHQECASVVPRGVKSNVQAIRPGIQQHPRGDHANQYRENQHPGFPDPPGNDKPPRTFRRGAVADCVRVRHRCEADRACSSFRRCLRAGCSSSDRPC